MGQCEGRNDIMVNVFMDKENQIWKVRRNKFGELRVGDKGVGSIKCFASKFRFKFKFTDK